MAFSSGEYELIDVTNSRSLIDIRGTDFGALLLVEGKPIALNWAACEGSIDHYLARAGLTTYEESLDSLRDTLSGNLRADVPICDQLGPFLELFVPGEYGLFYCQDVPDCDYAEYNSAWSATLDHEMWYPPVLIFTQPSDSLNANRVIEYLDELQKGHRPIALTATVPGSEFDFVIDGHHKLQAYKEARINPTFISVCRMDAPHLPPDTLARYFGSEHPKDEHFRKVNRRNY